jgi:hypothetical protein
VAEYFEHWLPRKLGTVAAATYRDYKQHIGKYVTQRIGMTALRDVVKGTIEELRANLADIDSSTGERRGLADKTIRKHTRRVTPRDDPGRHRRWADRGRPVP